MTAAVVNLRLLRKRKARLDAETQAANNRVAFGISRADKTLAESQRRIEVARLDGHRRDDAGLTDT